jgi:hypothetical protein
VPTCIRCAALATVIFLGGCGKDEPTDPGGLLELALLPVVTGLRFPLLVTAPLNDRSRLFIVEKGGLVRVIRDSRLLDTPFLDFSPKVSTGPEQGLLGLAFHRDYGTNRVFVISYTNALGDTRIVTMKASANPDVADPATERVILQVQQPFPNHNGGHVTFGPFGYLFIGLGDGGSAGDPGNRAQDLTTLLGKLLRLEVADDGAATIPAGNPFVGPVAARDEIWSRGLRNPWRFSFDRMTGDLYIGDVGQDRVEEVDVSLGSEGSGRAANFGWRLMEGSLCYLPASGCENLPALIRPVLEYDHGEGCSVTGGHVYRGPSIPELQGSYFYGDFCGGWVRSFRLVNGKAEDQQEWTDLSVGTGLTSFGEDADGELYLTTSGGQMYRIVRK